MTMRVRSACRLIKVGSITPGRNQVPHQAIGDTPADHGSDEWEFARRIVHPAGQPPNGRCGA